jgi:RNA polymerase sigma factor (sigma-70 family)
MIQMNAKTDVFWQLVKPHHLKIRAFCRKLSGNRENGDDLYQDSLIAALVAFESLNDHNSILTWLYRIVVNTFRNQQRRPWWKRTLPLRDVAEIDRGYQDPTNSYAARRLLDCLFRRISVKDQILITLFHLEGWPVSDMASLLGKSEGAIRVRLSRAREKMKEAFVKEEKYRLESKTRQFPYRRIRYALSRCKKQND